MVNIPFMDPMGSQTHEVINVSNRVRVATCVEILTQQPMESPKFLLGATMGQRKKKNSEDDIHV